MSSSWSLAKSKSTSDRESVWNARSHAAYQGYSHLSGIEMTSAFSMWDHSTFRTPVVSDWCSGSILCSASQRSRSK